MPIIKLPFIQEYPAPHGESASDQYPSALPHHFIETFTQKGQSVFDPFIGFGTTAFVAEDLGRVPFGVEADGERYEWGAGQLMHWQNIRHGDAGDLGNFDFPQMDFCVTSPPWMEREDEWNPLYGGDPKYAGYDSYLARIAEIFGAIKGVMKDGAHVVVHVQDVNDTPLLHDFRRLVSQHLDYVAAAHIDWDAQEKGALNQRPSLTKCLIFTA